MVRQVIVNMYKFDELSKEAQQKAIDKYRYINTEDEDFSWLKEQWINDLEKEGFDTTYKQIHWEHGTRSEGCSFSARVDVVRFLNHHDTTNKYPRVKEAFKRGDFQIDIMDDDGRHCFSNAMDIHITNNLEENKDEEDVVDMLETAIENGKSLEDSVAEVGDWILDIAKNKADKIFNELDSSIQELESDEAVADTIRLNEIEFDSN